MVDFRTLFIDLFIFFLNFGEVGEGPASETVGVAMAMIYGRVMTVTRSWGRPFWKTIHERRKKSGEKRRGKTKKNSEKRQPKR